MLAITLSAPPPCSQIWISSLNTRFNRCAHVIDTWRVGMDSSAGAAPRRPRLAGVTCSRSRWFGAPSYLDGAVVTREVNAWRWHPGGQAGNKILRGSCPPPFGPACGGSTSLQARLSSGSNTTSVVPA